jgi:hypothetical protein
MRMMRDITDKSKYDNYKKKIRITDNSAAPCSIIQLLKNRFSVKLGYKSLQN